MSCSEIDKEMANPLDLLRWNRFDLPFKYLFGYARKRGWDTDYYEEMYRHHLKVWNGFSEFDDPQKNSYEVFKADYLALLDEIGSQGFDCKKSLVALQDGEYLLNGAHRVAACLVHGENVGFYNGKDGFDGQKDCSWEFFKARWRRGRFDRDFCDRAALEFARLKPNSRLVVLYPSATKMGKVEQVRSILREHSGIVYEKAIRLSFEGGVNLMRELYLGEKWAEKRRGSGYVSKAKYCYQAGRILRRMSLTHVFLMEFENKSEADAVKDDIRAIYNIEKHSVHINDSHEETIRLCQSLFNRNSVHFLNHFNRRFYKKYERLLTEYTTWIKASGLDPEDYCVTAGGVLSAYGLKEAKDLDYLHSAPEEVPGNRLIQSHNLYGEGRYPTAIDDIVHNPRNHFYRYGVKHCGLGIVESLKSQRGERKDFRDLKMIRRIQ